MRSSLLVTCLALLLAACLLATYPLAAQESQQCWFNDPNDPDNLILTPCKVETPNGKPLAGKPQTQPQPTPKPAPPADKSTPTPHSSGPLVAGGWCAVQARNMKPHSSTGNSVDPTSGTTPNHGPGCDAGLGLALLTFHNRQHQPTRLSLVSVLGTKTLGIGLAWIVIRPTPSFPRVVALAIGAVVQYDSGGIYRQVYPALGATMSFRGRD
jgi:hypothetical protein